MVADDDAEGMIPVLQIAERDSEQEQALCGLVSLRELNIVEIVFLPRRVSPSSCFTCLLNNSIDGLVAVSTFYLAEHPRTVSTEGGIGANAGPKGITLRLRNC